ncbi:SdpI family protein [Anaerotignum sp. MB30-C6]|uniref:SdpI family protein n=1 Tax=Anaerotignum sp. MB30-C6 TaxID=3070814 RepID=UPI0027DD3F34|nr:SdpI family protein [Anaerotignum sp. MB30-C6]WMI80768.1 SdpI family protein [Anaerotignum sp. MB30-C6]
MSKKRVAIYFFGALPLIMVSLVYQKLPELVPMQWQTGGGVRYGDKWELFMIAGLSLVMGVIVPILAKIDPKRKNYSKFSNVYESMVLLIEIFMAVIMGVVIMESLYPHRIPVTRVVSVSVGLLLVLLGNMLPKVKSNFFTGVKTPWALSSETVWNKTQRIGGKMFFLSGLLMAVGSLFVPMEIMSYVAVVLLSITLIVPTIMSYIWYQNEIKSLGK